MTDIERERARVLENIGLAFVNGEISKAEAERLKTDFIAEWRRIDNEQTLENVRRYAPRQSSPRN